MPAPDNNEPIASAPRSSPRSPAIADLRWLALVFALSLAARLIYALWIHPPSDFVFSDMKGYYTTATRWLSRPTIPHRSSAFFPLGTSWLIALCRLISFGNVHVTHAYWALLAAPVAPLLMLATRRLTHHSWAGRIAGLVGALYYPFISYSGYFLSEAPFATCLACIVWIALRFADEGRSRDAFLAGLLIGASSWLSPQILLSIPLAGIFWLSRRKSFAPLRPQALALMALGLGLCLLITFGFTRHHSGRGSIVSQNGAVNRVFARCHNSELHGRNGWFGLPPYGALESWHKRRPYIPVKVNPVRTRRIDVPHRLDEEAKLHQLADACVAESSRMTQLRNASTNVLLLWGFNIAWPDVTRRPFSRIMRAHNGINLIVLLPPTLLSLLWLGLRRGRERLGLVSSFMWVVIATAAAFIGGTRLRTPFDTVMIVLSAACYLSLFRWLKGKWKARPASTAAPGWTA